MDAVVGEVMDKLEERGLTKNSFVIFSSDVSVAKPGSQQIKQFYKLSTVMYNVL